jgi:phosphotransferase system HPr-like phosphotransfer protein
MARGLAELTPDSVHVRVVNTLTQREGDGKAILDVLSLGLGGDVTFEVHVKGEKSAISLVKDQIRRFLLSYISTDDVTPQKS